MLNYTENPICFTNTLANLRLFSKTTYSQIHLFISNWNRKITRWCICIHGVKSEILPTFIIMNLHLVTLKDICHLKHHSSKKTSFCNRIESSIEVIDLNILEWLTNNCKELWSISERSIMYIIKGKGPRHYLEALHYCNSNSSIACDWFNHLVVHTILMVWNMHNYKQYQN